jgi:ABC-2 type transport system permease protein
MTTTTPQRRPAVSLGAEALAFARRKLEHIRQVPEKLLDVTVQPLMIMLLFAYVFGGAIEIEGGSYREYLLAGILVQSLVFGLMGPGSGMAADLRDGVVDRFRSLPVRRGAYLLGHYLAELAGGLLAITILFATGLAMGWRAHTGVGSIVTAVALVVVFTSALIWFGTYVGMLVRSPDAVTGVGFTIIFPLVFVSNVFVPIDTMPGPLQWVAVWNPVSAVTDAIRELCGNPVVAVGKDAWPLDHPVAAAWTFSTALLVVSVAGTLRRYHRRRPA